MANLNGPTGAITAPDAQRHAALAIDLGERLLLLALYVWFLSEILPSVADQPYNLLLTISESFTAMLVLVRRPGPMATTPYAWAVAIVGTCAPLLVLPTPPPLVPAWSAALLMVYGLFISLSAKLFLRRSFGIVAARRGVRRGGPYRLVRHPMYLGYSLTQIGFFMLNPSLWNGLIYAATFAAMWLRIGEEEKMLSQDEAYRDYAAAVRFRLVPGLF